jgi:hypothetical protein
MITIVSGFQRCGSSLMCQMLNAGGLRVFHDQGMGYPSFETMSQFHRADDPTWLEAIDGQAVKWLEPQRAMPAPVTPELRIVWMTRHHREQAKSAAKFMTHVGGFVLPSKIARVFAASYDRDEPRAVHGWRQRGLVHVLDFAQILAEPARTASEVSAFLGLSLDVDRMAAEVRPRSAKCLDGFLELDLIAAAIGSATHSKKKTS